MLHPSICPTFFGHGSTFWTWVKKQISILKSHFCKMFWSCLKMFGPLEGHGSQSKKYDKMPSNFHTLGQFFSVLTHKSMTSICKFISHFIGEKTCFWTKICNSGHSVVCDQLTSVYGTRKLGQEKTNFKKAWFLLQKIC